MKKSIKILAIILAAITLAISVYAATTSKNIEIFYRNIKIMIDGAEYVPTDVNGNIVEPFIHNGTTYLPVRAVAKAFGKDVKWDGANAIVYLGNEDRMGPDARLDNLQYISYSESDSHSWFERINGTVTDHNGTIYTNGMVGYIYDYKGICSAEYALNGQYTNFTGKFVIPKVIDTTTRTETKCDNAEYKMTVTDENDTVLFEATGINGSFPYSFDIDVDGVNKIKLKVSAMSDKYIHFALVDLGLYE